MSEGRTFYCFRLNKETGEITRLEIKDYKFDAWKGYPVRRRCYMFKVNSNRYCAYEDEFDRFKNDRVYSFNGSMEHAVQIIYKHLEEKRNAAEKEYKKFDERITNLCRLYMNNNEVAT